jgi:hypothetical protein
LDGSTARRDGFPPGENFTSDGTTTGKIGALETVALAKNAIDRPRFRSSRSVNCTPHRAGSMATV